ncbi:lipase 3 [Monomorium pharaonis]|uniref:lipase 3 n=1 Tax=Monomorium pharaonis TaxID=307658 RepID=UPI00063F7CE1|nr:lipase 3 [Monomorium pharaonis]
MNSLSTAMLLPIFLISILASINANLLDDLIDNIQKLNLLEQIPELPNQLPTAPEDAKLTTMELISKYGYNGEMHKVTTSDGYTLELHRITGPATESNSTKSNVQKPIVFVMHGIMCNSAAFTISGREKSLAFILADEGYDVWLGNARGSTYARNHTDSKIKKKDYWNFSWHEIGTIDLPATIDHIVKTTGLKKMFYIGHSQGTTAFFVMATELPEYQKYIEEAYIMAPIVYSGRMKSPLLQLMSQFSLFGEYLWKLVGFYEFNLDNDIVKGAAQLICSEKAITQPICSNVMFLLTGFNPEQLDPALIPVILGHAPASTSAKQLMHYAQLIKTGRMISPGRFQKYDYGLIGNKKLYDSLSPAKYDLSKVKVPVHLYYSENDWLSNVKDVEKLYSELSNPSGKTLIANKKFNHVDYIWAKDVKTLVYDQILGEMKKRML